MPALADARRRMLALRGRPMVLRRGNLPDLTVQGFARDYRPEELAGGIQQGDLRVEIGQDEIRAAGWPAPPIKPDRLVLDGRTYAVMGARIVLDGQEVAGWTLWVRGGQA